MITRTGTRAHTIIAPRIHQRLIWYKQREDPSGREVAVQIDMSKVVYVVFVRHC